MKKKISLLLTVLIMIFSLAGCSDKNDADGAYDEAALEQTAEVIINSFAQMSEEEFDQFRNLSDFQLNYTMMQTGLRISGEDFIGMIDSWEAAENECGEYQSHNDYDVEVKTKEIVVSTLAQFEEKEATIAFGFDEELNMKSMDVSAKLSIGEILTKAGLNTLLGMGTVFAVLIFLAFLISLLKYIPAIMEKLTKKAKPVEAEESLTVEETSVAEEVDDLELIAVITAAIAAQEDTSTDDFIVRSIRRKRSNNWN